MLSPADLARMDLTTLRAERRRAQELAMFEDRCRRRARQVGIPSGFPNTIRIVESFEDDAAASAAQESLIALAIRFAADEASGRPALAPPKASLRGASAQGLIARALATLTGAPTRKGERAA